MNESPQMAWVGDGTPRSLLRALMHSLLNPLAGLRAHFELEEGAGESPALLAAIERAEQVVRIMDLTLVEDGSARWSSVANVWNRLIPQLLPGMHLRVEAEHDDFVVVQAGAVGMSIWEAMADIHAELGPCVVKLHVEPTGPQDSAELVLQVVSSSRGSQEDEGLWSTRLRIRRTSLGGQS